MNEGLFGLGDTIIYRYVDEGRVFESSGFVIYFPRPGQYEVIDCNDAQQRALPPGVFVSLVTDGLPKAKRPVGLAPTNRVERSQNMTWLPNAHTDDENALWSFLRATEWARWPVFLSQVYAPPFLLFLSWKTVVGIVVALNVIWWLLGFVLDVNIRLAFWGALANQAKWFSWVPCTIVLFLEARSPESWVCLFWFLIVFPIGLVPPVPIKPLQIRFMAKLGYSPSQ
jgi:hypothetical protein